MAPPSSSQMSPSTAPGLSSRRSFSSPRSPSTSPETSPETSPGKLRKRPLRRRREGSDKKSFYRLMWTATWLCLVALLRWRYCTSFNMESSGSNTLGLPIKADKWKNRNVVQVIQTRFMQEQPHLVDLGMARLEIFKTFCLPTMVGQSSQDFLWIIRTDPMLNDIIKLPLLELLKPYPHFILVASNSNPEGFRSKIVDISPETAWSGSYELIQEYHEAAQSRVLLESRLDADDGVHYEFVEYIQTISPLPREGEWKIWCALSHLEWHADSPFNSDESDYGFLVGIKHTGCVTPGLTMSYGVGVSRQDLPRGTHQYLHKILPACHKEKGSTNCLERFALNPGAIRARTPTSAGMAHLVQEHNHKKKYMRVSPQANFQYKIWEATEPLYRLDRKQVIQTKNYLKEHLAAIAADNLKGQCTKGHSCKQDAKIILQKILHQAE